MDRRRHGPAVAAAYAERRDERAARAAARERDHARLSTARLAVFGAALAIVGTMGAPGVPWLALPALAFLGLALRHAQVLNARDRAARAVAYYERGIARLEDRWMGAGDPGERYRDATHPCADDLDLFGSGSLFELLSTPRTGGGQDTLAGWLREPAAPARVRERQAAVAELATRLDLQEELAIAGPDVAAAVNTAGLRAWALETPRLTTTWPRVVLPVLAAASTGLIAWWIWTGNPPALLLPALAAQSAVALLFKRAVADVTERVGRRERELRVLAALLGRVEREPVESARLVALRDAVRASGHSPEEEVRRLARLVDVLASRENQLFAPIAALLCLRTQLAFAVEAWRRRLGPTVSAWIDSLAEYEALAALATYAGEHPDDPFPELVDGPALIEAEGITHPLLPATGAVPNDVRLGGTAPQVLLVSGSNMAGKSTLLRTIGINVVLAQAGAPVRATRLRLSPLRVGATLRIQDSLQQGRSRFYAEITRLHQVVAMARAAATAPDGVGVLCLFDELLAGTNSHDREIGSESILRGLVDLGALGLVTTHDLALAAIADRLAPRAANVHLADRFEDGVLHFDYRLRPGVVRTSNAVALMRSVGLDIE
ncbi:MAG: DNA mismatch repair protein MutS [Vicinamibacterales bacterium]